MHPPTITDAVAANAGKACQARQPRSVSGRAAAGTVDAALDGSMEVARAGQHLHHTESLKHARWMRKSMVDAIKRCPIGINGCFDRRLSRLTPLSQHSYRPGEICAEISPEEAKFLLCGDQGRTSRL